MGFLSINKILGTQDNNHTNSTNSVTNQNLNSVFTEGKYNITSKPTNVIDVNNEEDVIKTLLNNQQQNQEKLKLDREFNQLKETLLENSKITKREDPKLGTCYSCRGHETNMRGKQGAIDLAALALRDLVDGKKEYLELSKKNKKDLTDDQLLQMFSYEQTLKSMQLTIDNNGNLVNIENCEYSY